VLCPDELILMYFCLPARTGAYATRKVTIIAEQLSKTVVERIKTADQVGGCVDDTLADFGIRVRPSGSAATSSNIATTIRCIEAPDHWAARSAVDL
jgi:hypothetical protein